MNQSVATIGFKNVGITAVYLLCGHLTALFLESPNPLYLLWLPAAIALVILWLDGYAWLPGIFFGAFFTLSTNNQPLNSSLALSLLHLAILFVLAVPLRYIVSHLWALPTSPIQQLDFFQLLSAELPGLFVLFDKEQQIFLANDNFLAAAHNPEGQRTLPLFEQFIAPVDRPKVQEALTLLASGQTTPIEACLNFPAQPPTPYLLSIKLLQYSGQCYYLCHAANITTQKQAHEALRSSEERYRMLLENSPFGIQIFEMDGTLSYVNPKWEEIWQTDGQSVINQFNVLNDQIIQEGPRWEPILAIFSGEEAVVPDTLYDPGLMGRQGRKRWIRTHPYHLRDENGRLLNVVVLNEDITETKQAELNLTEHQQFITFQKVLLEHLVETSLDGILITNHERKWVYYNRRFIDIWGIVPKNEQTMKNATVEDLQEIIFNGVERIHLINHLFDNPTMTAREEIFFRDGRIFDFFSAPVLGEDGTYYGRLWSYRDVTKQRQLEQQLRQAQKMEAIGRLAGGIAHDFNNLLVPMLGYVDLSLRQVEPSSKLHRYLSRARQASQQAAQITQQILAFSRKQMLTMQIVDLNQLIREFEPFAKLAIQEHTKLNLELAPSPLPVEVDQTQINQVLLNLIINARDAMPSGGTITLSIKPRHLSEPQAHLQPVLAAGAYACLLVQDSGEGIAIETQSLIFEPFFTTKESGKGSGLGLSTAFGIVKQHQGHISVQSEPGQGSTFEILLPLQETAVSLPKSKTNQPPTPSQPITILIAEDNLDVLTFTAETLREQGYHVLETAHPEATHALAEKYQGQIDLLLTDLIMPNMNGVTLYQAIRQYHADIKVLFMSGYADGQSLPLNQQHDHPHLQKPFTAEQLLQQIHLLLQK